MADFRYYMHQQEERHFKIDHQKIKVTLKRTMPPHPRLSHCFGRLLN